MHIRLSQATGPLTCPRDFKLRIITIKCSVLAALVSDKDYKVLLKKCLKRILKIHWPEKISKKDLWGRTEREHIPCNCYGSVSKTADNFRVNLK